MEDPSINIVIGDQTLNATLWDNHASKSLLEQQPLTLELSDYGGQEVTAVPPHSITTDGMPDSDTAVTGDLPYYAPNGVVVMHYSEIGHWSGIVILGRFDGDLSVIKGRSASFSVTIERAN